eukprot:1185689-Prorocentrum_minimum.AAC.1
MERTPINLVLVSSPASSTKNRSLQALLDSAPTYIPKEFPSSTHLADGALMSRLMPSTSADEPSTSADEPSTSSAASGSDVPVLLYCRPDKALPYVFCGELGEAEVVAGSTQRREEDDEGTSGRPPVLVWTLLDYEQLMEESEHFRNLVRFSGVGI